MDNKAESYIELKLSPKGKYYWAIKVVFDKESPIERIKELDGKLRDFFPKNASEQSQSSSRYSEVEDF